MKLEAATARKFLKRSSGAVLTALLGLILCRTPLGDPWVNASYDYLFRFGSRAVSNNVVVVQLDNEAYSDFHQRRGQPWDRALDAQLLNKLADDGCSMVVLDSFFRTPRDPEKDAFLAAALKRQRRVVLMAEQAGIIHPDIAGAQPALPSEPFLSAAAANWGVAWLDPDGDDIVRRQWPFPAPGPFPSLAETTARLAGAKLDSTSHERWLRYYGRAGNWPKLSFGFALQKSAGYFHDKIVFVGSDPETTVMDGEPDEFRTPYSRWTRESIGGVQIMVTEFLNLMNHDWLRRPSGWIECLMLAVSGVLFGWFLPKLRWRAACVFTMGGAVAIALGFICWSYFSNYWFPWLLIVGAQMPCALVFALAVPESGRHRVKSELLQPERPVAQAGDAEIRLPEIPGYELIQPAFGRGAYGRIWLARNRAGEWRAVKVVFRSSFGEDDAPYDREFNGIQRYKPVSVRHPGLLRIYEVSEKRPENFYYVMELGDSLENNWQRTPASYEPRDLTRECRRMPGKRLPLADCLQIGIELCDALHFLHQQNLTHRDIKPQNILFVDSRPKLADAGLVAEVRQPGGQGTYVGTPGYLPPLPERPGTREADIYALGMVLYVISTGRTPTFFPEMATSIVEQPVAPEFFRLNSIILKACAPNAGERFGSAAEMGSSLSAVMELVISEKSEKTAP